MSIHPQICWWALLDAAGMHVETVQGPPPQHEQYPHIARAVRLPRRLDAQAERWCPVAGIVLAAGASAPFEAEIDRLAMRALDPRPAIAELHCDQLAEAQRFLAAGEQPDDLEAAYPQLAAQALDAAPGLDAAALEAAVFARAEAVLAGATAAAASPRRARINARRQGAKREVRAAADAATMAAAMLAFRDWLEEFAA